MHLSEWVGNWLGYLIGLYFPLPSKGQTTALSIDAVSARVRYLPQSYYKKYSSVSFFQCHKSQQLFFLSGLYLTLKTVKDMCSPLSVLEDFHCSDRFSFPWLSGWVPHPSWGSIFTGSADPAVALQVIDCCFSNNKAYSFYFYYFQSTFPFLKSWYTFQIFWPNVRRRLRILQTNQRETKNEQNLV